MCHTMALPFTLKRILRQKKNYGNSNISPCKSIILTKTSKRNQNPSRYYNSITNLKFQHNQNIIFQKSSRWTNMVPFFNQFWSFFDIWGFTLLDLFYVFNCSMFWIKKICVIFFCIFCSFVLCYYVMWYWV